MQTKLWVASRKRLFCRSCEPDSFPLYVVVVWSGISLFIFISMRFILYVSTHLLYAFFEFSFFFFGLALSSCLHVTPWFFPASSSFSFFLRLLHFYIFLFNCGLLTLMFHLFITEIFIFTCVFYFITRSWVCKHFKNHMNWSSWICTMHIF